MDLILLRHGETDNNYTKIYNDNQTPLNDTGRLQIERAADKIQNMIIDQALVSPHLRTRQTFEIIQSYHDIPYNIVEDIREIDAGLIKGKSYDQASLLFPNEMDAYMKNHIEVGFPEGESVRDVYKRAGKFLKDVQKLDSNVLVVSHMGFISILIANVLGDINLYDKFHIDNGAFSLIRLSPYPSIRYINRI